MKTSQYFIRKLLIGMVLIFLCGVISIFLKESLDTLDPESSLPILTITQNGTPISGVQRVEYVWSFFTTIERHSQPVQEDNLSLVATPVSPQAKIELHFSSEPSSLKVFRAQAAPVSQYLEITETPNTFLAPHTPGIYLYQILAEWGSRGYVQYHFSIQVS